MVRIILVFTLTVFIPRYEIIRMNSLITVENLTNFLGSFTHGYDGRNLAVRNDCLTTTAQRDGQRSNEDPPFFFLEKRNDFGKVVNQIFNQLVIRWISHSAPPSLWDKYIDYAVAIEPALFRG